MAIKNLSNGEVYTFAKINGAPIIKSGTDGATAVTKFRNNVEISGSNSAGLLTIKSSNKALMLHQYRADTQNFPILELQNASGATTSDCWVRMYGNNEYWSFGVDGTDNAFKIAQGSVFSTANDAAFRLYEPHAGVSVNNHILMSLRSDTDTDAFGMLELNRTGLCGSYTSGGSYIQNIWAMDSIYAPDWSDSSGKGDWGGHWGIGYMHTNSGNSFVDSGGHQIVFNNGNNGDAITTAGISLSNGNIKTIGNIYLTGNIYFDGVGDILATGDNALNFYTEGIKRVIIGKDGSMSVGDGESNNNKITIFEAEQTDRKRIECGADATSAYVNGTWGTGGHGDVQIRNNGTVMADFESSEIYFFNIDSHAGTHYLKWDSSDGEMTYASSTRNIKKNIVVQSGSNDILSVEPVSYDFKSNSRKDQGFIAEQVAEINPLFATYGPDFVYDENGAKVPKSGSFDIESGSRTRDKRVPKKDQFTKEDGFSGRYELKSNAQVPIDVNDRALLSAAIQKIQDLEARLKVLENA